MNSKRTIKSMMLAAAAATALLPMPLPAAPKATKEQIMAVFLIESDAGETGSAGTGFACKFRDREFIATNLHVLEGATSLAIKPQGGGVLKLTGKLIVAEDADICLLEVAEPFGGIGVKPLEFMADVFAESKSGDEIVCLGNSLGNGVITPTQGTIKAFGKPRIEIECPTVKGNSGGPIIHMDSGKVVGLVTEAIINKSTFDELGVAANKSEKSPVSDISYFGHRIDTARKWSASTIADHSKTSKLIASADLGLQRATLFLADKEGWQEDRRISEAWNEYSAFVEKADKVNTKRVETKTYVNEFGVVVRRDTKVKGISVSEADYQRARDRFKRAIEWKILADQEVLKKLKPIGYRQAEARRLSVDFSNKVLLLQKEL